jgi:2,3-bisphosphoglycerate-dependent phosphoglycerate mutase
MPPRAENDEEDIPDDVIPEVNIPTGMPLVYELEANLKPIRNYYLGDPKR